MRCIYGAIVIFIIFFEESEASDSNSDKWTWNKLKLSLGKDARSKGKQSRLDVVGTPKRMDPKDFYKQRKAPAMDLATQQDLELHQARPSASPAMDLLSQYKAQHPRSRPKSPQKSHRKKYLPVDSNPLYPAELGPAPPNQLLMNGEILSESQAYQMGLQHHGKYDPLYAKPPMFPSNFETSGASGYPNTQPEPYFETEADREAYLMAGQRHGNYPPLHSKPPRFPSNSETSGASGYPNNHLESYFETDADRRAYLIAGQRHGNYAPLHPNPSMFLSNFEPSGSYHDTADGGTSGASGASEYSSTKIEPYFGTEIEREANLMYGQHHGNYFSHNYNPSYFDSDQGHSGSG